MTREEHIARHKLLREHFDDLFADYIIHHPKEDGFLNQPLSKLLYWASEQCINPTEVE